VATSWTEPSNTPTAASEKTLKSCVPPSAPRATWKAGCMAPPLDDGITGLGSGGPWSVVVVAPLLPVRATVLLCGLWPIAKLGAGARVPGVGVVLATADGAAPV